MKQLISTLVFASLSILANHSLAMDSQDSGVSPAQKWYQIEVLIFSQQDVFGDEVSPRDIILAYPDNLIDLDNNNQGFIALPDSARKLGPDAYTMNRTGVYKVLFHKAWRQPGRAPQQTPWIMIKAEKPDSSLNGSLRIYLSNYLYLNTNFWLTRYAGLRARAINSAAPPALNAEASAESSTLEAASLSPEPSPWPLPPTPPSASKSTDLATDFANTGATQFGMTAREINEIVLLKQSSRLKLNKLYYFDHPKLGLLIRVSRYAKAPIKEPTKSEGVIE